MNQLRENHQSGRVMGFATKYYTLWNISCNPYYNENGMLVGYNWSGTFIKNISTSLDKAMKEYPDLEIDRSLQGTRKYTMFERVMKCYPDDVFDFGRYAGSPILECTDIDYLVWAYDQLSDTRKTYAMRVLVHHGYHFVGNNLYDEDGWNMLNENLEFSKCVERGETLRIMFEKSLSSDGGYYYRGYDIRFKDYDRFTYKGYDYALPILQGKAKRIKGKMLSIDKYTSENGLITVESFGIIKNQ